MDLLVYYLSEIMEGVAPVKPINHEPLRSESPDNETPGRVFHNNETKTPWNILNGPYFKPYTLDIPKRYDILDKGYINVLDTFGDELTIVNAARASFEVSKDILDEKDIGLLKYLWKNKHNSPMRHCMIRLKIKAPEFVLRQLFRHHVGIEASGTYITQLHGWSERSGRYKVVDEYYYPKEWRSQSSSVKQGSDGILSDEDDEYASDIFRKAMCDINNAYEQLLRLGVAKEQARILLPLNQYGTIIWTASLEALLFFISQRADSHAQWEIREYANVIDKIVKNKFPHLYDIIHAE